jgi:hypothetical protein
MALRDPGPMLYRCDAQRSNRSLLALRLAG